MTITNKNISAEIPPWQEIPSWIENAQKGILPKMDRVRLSDILKSFDRILLAVRLTGTWSVGIDLV